MTITCPGSAASTIKKNGHIQSGKQNHRCLVCGRQFVLNPDQKRIPQEHKEQIRQALLERVSLEGVCRIFSVSMPWLLRFIEEIIAELPDDLHATVTSSDELEAVVIELDEQWSYVQNKKNQQWLWLVFHQATRQVLAMHVGKQSRQSAETLLSKLPEEIKRKPSFTQICSQSISRSFLGNGISPLGKEKARQTILRDLILPCVKDVHD